MQYLRCRCEQLLSASRKRLIEAARVRAFVARISTFASTTLKKLLAITLCGAAMLADGVATIPSIRPNGARSGLSDQLAQAVQSSSAGGKPRSLGRRNSLRKRLRFARNGGHHRNARRIGGSCLSDRGSFAGLYSHFWLFFLRRTILEPRLI